MLHDAMTLTFIFNSPAGGRFEPKTSADYNFFKVIYTVSQEPQCARFSRVFTCPPIV